MDNFKPLVWISLAGLFIVFGVICSLRFFFRKSPRLLRYKLKIGGIILTISGVLTLNGCGTTCYTTYPYVVLAGNTNFSEIDSVSYVNLVVTNRIRFQASSYPALQKLSYQLQDTNDVFIESNDVQAFDGNFDSDIEEFHVYLPASLTNGLYKLNFYTDSKTNQNTNNRIWTYPFRVTNF